MSLDRLTEKEVLELELGTGVPRIYSFATDGTPERVR
jgi:hypothetical protein